MQNAFQSYELRLSQQIPQYSVVDPSANAAFYGGARGAVGRGSGTGRGVFSKSGVKSLICQLCGKAGHVALKCFKRFDVHFTGSTDSPSPQELIADCGSPEAGNAEQIWYMDSGATNHITNELVNLSISSDYHGSEYHSWEWLDHNLQDVRTKIFPYKRMKVRAPEVASPVTLPAKRKERSLSSLVVSTPRMSSQNGMTGRRSKSITRKASRGSSFTIEKPVKKEDSTMEDYHESSSSPETLNKSTQNMRQSSAASEPSNHPSPDKGRDNGSDAWEEKVDLWKPLNCLVEAANRSKSSKFSVQGFAKSEAKSSHENEGILNKSKSKENRQKSKVQDVKNFNDHTTPISERPKKFRKVRQKKAQEYGEFRVPPQRVLDAAGVTLDSKNYPIWFSLVSDGQDGNALPLPQIAARFLRIKDGGMPVSFIQKYLKLKLDLPSEDEVEIKCMGQAMIPTLTLNSVVDLWLQTVTGEEKVSAKIGSSAKDLVMVLGYARRGTNS